MVEGIPSLFLTPNVTAKLPRLPLPGLAETDVDHSTAVSKKNAMAGSASARLLDGRLPPFYDRLDLVWLRLLLICGN